MLPKVRAVSVSDRCLELPDGFDIHEWFPVDDFAGAQDSEMDAARTAGCHSWTSSLSGVSEYDSTTGYRTELVSVP